jgi:hypothetical protein
VLVLLHLPLRHETGIDKYAPKDFHNMPIIYMANDGRPNTMIVALEYVDQPGSPHALALETLCTIREGKEVRDWHWTH